jgi:hypothetical protein
VWRLGNRWRLFGRHHKEYEQGGVVPVGPSDAEVIARAARCTLRILAGPGDLDEVVRDLRAILIRSEAGRAVLGRPLDALGEDPVDVLTRERDEARNTALHLTGRLATARDVLVEAQDERNRVTAELAEWMRAANEARNERDEATRELAEVNGGYLDLIDAILGSAPESWDGDEAGHAIALDYVAALNWRLDALRVPREKYSEFPDGSVWPDPRTDPHGYADAVAEYQRAHSGCRCAVLGDNAPEHAPSVVCQPRPGDRRCTNPGCAREGEFGHDDEPMPADDPWTSGDGTAPVAVPSTSTLTAIHPGPECVYPALSDTCMVCGVVRQWCGKPIDGGEGAPEMICGKPAGHDPTPWCGFAEIAARADAVRDAASGRAHPTCIEVTGGAEMIAGRRAWICGPSCPEPPPVRTCTECGSTRWVAVRLNGPDSPRRAQCVPCGTIGDRIGEDE